MPEKQDAARDALLGDRKHHGIRILELVVELHADHSGVDAAVDLVEGRGAVAGLHEAVATDTVRVAFHGREHGVVGLPHELEVGQ